MPLEGDRGPPYTPSYTPSTSFAGEAQHPRYDYGDVLWDDYDLRTCPPRVETVEQPLGPLLGANGWNNCHVHPLGSDKDHCAYPSDEPSGDLRPFDQEGACYVGSVFDRRPPASPDAYPSHDNLQNPLHALEVASDPLSVWGNNLGHPVLYDEDDHSLNRELFDDTHLGYVLFNDGYDEDALFECEPPADTQWGNFAQDSNWNAPLDPVNDTALQPTYPSPTVCPLADTTVPSRSLTPLNCSQNLTLLDDGLDTWSSSRPTLSQTKFATVSTVEEDVAKQLKGHWRPQRL